MCVSSFLEQHFCCAKVIACGRMIEREWGNPQRFPPHTPPSLRYAGVRTTKPVDDHKKERHPCGCLSFLERHFCCAKVIACGRMIEREWGNPSKVPPSHSPFLAVCGSANNKACGQSHKETPFVRMVFSFWNVAGRLELAASTGAKRVKSRGPAGLPRMALPFAGRRFVGFVEPSSRRFFCI